MNSLFVKCLCFLIFGACSNSVLTAQTPLIPQVPNDPRATYSPLQETLSTGKVIVKSNRYSGPISVIFTELSRFPITGPGASSLDYGLFDPNSNSRLTVTGIAASSGEVLTDLFPPLSMRNDRITLFYEVRVSPLSMPAPGTITITLQADLYAGTFGNLGIVVDSVIFTLSVNVGTFHDVSVVPSGNIFVLKNTKVSLAFVTLNPDVEINADILVRSNISYNLALSSANGGALINSTDGSLLPYSLLINGGIFTLLSGVQTPIATGGTTSFGTPTLYALKALVRPYLELPSPGSFTDTITVILLGP